MAAALLARGEEFLICQRSAAGSFPGRWEFPGGKIEPGEAPADAIRRELHEELGIRAEIGEEVTRVTHQYEGHRAVLVIFFEVRRYDKPVENRVFSQICWAAPRDLPRYDFLDADRILVKKLAEGEIRVRPADAPQAGSHPPS